MARITYVKSAQQRYKMVPKLDATGAQITVPVLNNRTGEQKKTKHGRPVTRSLTVADKDQPLPNHKCEACQVEIKVGDAYKHVSPKTGPYGGATRYRCASCPSWEPWDLSSSVPVMLSKLSHDFNAALDTAESKEDVESALEDAASAAEELGDQREESGQNMEDGFGHETEQSNQLKEDGEALKSWAEEIRNADVPELPEPEEDDCEECDASGRVDPEDEDAEGKDENGLIECENCSGTGQATPEEPTEQQIEDWREECRDACSIVDEAPI